MSETMAGTHVAYFVANAHLENFKHHVVHLQWTSDNCSTLEEQCPDRALFLVEELKTFAMYAQSWNFLRSSTSVCILSRPNEALQYSLPTQARGNHKFSVSVLTPELTRQDLTAAEILTLEKDLIASCHQLCGNYVQFEINDLRSARLLDDLRQRSNQNIGFVDAMGWNLLELILFMEDRTATGDLTDGGLLPLWDAACTSYELLCSWVLEILSPKPAGKAPVLKLVSPKTSLESSWEHGLLVTLADILVTTVCLQHETRYGSTICSNSSKT